MEELRRNPDGSTYRLDTAVFLGGNTCKRCGGDRADHGVYRGELVCPDVDGAGDPPKAARPLPPAVDEFPIRPRAPGPPPERPHDWARVHVLPPEVRAVIDKAGAQLDAARDSNAAIGAVVAGLGKDAPTTTNAAGGRQSATPYRCDLLPPFAVLAVAEVLAEGAAKYGERNWHKITVGEHLNHALGHVFAALAGDLSDDHLEHAACRILFALDQRRSGREGGAK